MKLLRRASEAEVIFKKLLLEKDLLNAIRDLFDDSSIVIII